jgi:hypothetical protein
MAWEFMGGNSFLWARTAKRLLHSQKPAIKQPKDHRFLAYML